MASVGTSGSANHSYKATATSGSGASNVGSRQIYEAGDQRNPSQSEIRERERYKEGQSGSHLANDSKDERSIANRLGREEQRSRKDERPYDPEAELSKKDPTAPVCRLLKLSDMRIQLTCNPPGHTARQQPLERRPD
ncbi:conserved hypothetical protein [Talaromyces stipitatus ATCC 10500]|uniref:Uncharacterized protein n=1 Tax=Talaromyces stipitatus (strain ATCC 10500 / CBS 375.48 / QM 6759 / NRRL 1006) TaxID=441959 RepID=B8MRH4_TALSN|nr:uncharacterized protein TSTA_056100 [Talaromyces stipitatus ATCC 10500]EED13111.1 conserved hypothetical protein [Talaromyces stipitatus ATCC 10500]